MRRASRKASKFIQSLVPESTRESVKAYTALNSEATKTTRLEEFRLGSLRMMCCTIAIGLGCDIPDIHNAVIYGVDTFSSYIQKGGRAGRSKDIEAKMFWLVEDWVFENSFVPLPSSRTTKQGRVLDGFQTKSESPTMEERRAKSSPECGGP